MARFHGIVGFVNSVDTGSGVWEDEVVEVDYKGDTLRNNNRWQPNERLNADITLNNSISIVADSYAIEKYQAIRFIEWRGSCWEVTSVDIQRPRLILTIGGVYNGPRQERAPKDI